MHIHIHTIYTYFFLLCYVSGFSTINLPATKRLERFSLKVIFFLFSNTNDKARVLLQKTMYKAISDFSSFFSRKTMMPPAIPKSYGKCIK